MGIENWEEFRDSLPDWDVLKGCFGSGNIRPSDVDGIVERNGVCLFLEHKREGSGARISRGQERTFQGLAGQGNTVLVYWTDDPEKRNVVRIVCFHGGTRTLAENPSLDLLRHWCKGWYRRADAR